MRVRAVCFDVGETLIDETRHWGEWADFLGVPRLTLFATLGMTMWRGQPHRRVFDLFRPDLDLATARRQRQALGWRYDFLAEDLYPDAIPCLLALRERGIRVLVAGNQPIEAEAALARIGLPAVRPAGVSPSPMPGSSPRLSRSPGSPRIALPMSAIGSTTTCCRRAPRAC
jgi:FMN phosphatase YigB (HAD superfamily)